jgi:acyl phosphate:glycerol-3-phosphate acyltransferase
MTSSWAVLVLFVVAGYLAGSIPFGWLIGKMRGVDIRQLGSKNIGATNCGRVCGWPFGLAAFLLDVAKGFLPVGAATVWFLWKGYPLVMTLPSWGEDGYVTWDNFGGPIPAIYQLRLLAVVLVALAAILGHTFPVWLKFKGGKAVATALGVVLAVPMFFWPALIAFGSWVVVTAATRYVSVGSTVAAIVVAGAYVWLEGSKAWDDDLPATVFLGLVVVLVIVRHVSNYARLIKGTENKLWGGKKQPPPA